MRLRQTIQQQKIADGSSYLIDGTWRPASCSFTRSTALWCQWSGERPLLNAPAFCQLETICQLEISFSSIALVMLCKQNYNRSWSYLISEVLCKFFSNKSPILCFGKSFASAFVFSQPFWRMDLTWDTYMYFDRFFIDLFWPISAQFNIVF